MLRSTRVAPVVYVIDISVETTVAGDEIVVIAIDIPDIVEISAALRKISSLLMYCSADSKLCIKLIFPENVIDLVLNRLPIVDPEIYII